MSKRRIAILGSTGSIGCQALEVIACHPDVFEVEVLTAKSRAELLITQAIAYKPNAVVITDIKQYEKVKDALLPHHIKVYTGEAALSQVVAFDTVDIVLTALVGFSGLLPTINAIKHGKPIALANKETLVVAGSLVTGLAKTYGVNIYPVDSEHSAIFQCLAGEFHNPIEKIILTASGGPFRGKTKEQLHHVTKAQALKHPNWDMGAKITIDSATLMNKGFEVIEAKWLFGLRSEQIDVVVHPQSIIHSLVQFEDGSIKCQMGLPDMRLPIQYALAYPERLKADFPRFDFTQYPSLTFEAPDRAAFPCLDLAFEALRKGGNYACALNAANEVAVQAFIEDRIQFMHIPYLAEYCMSATNYIENPELDDYLATDSETRAKAWEEVLRLSVLQK
jgi:1-deoxy-D-xylulose-5-phosphate reductoisomerase